MPIPIPTPVMTLDELNTLSPNDAKAELFKCCGSSNWVDQIVLARPLSSKEELLDLATETWNALTPQDWLEAFSHHPRIGKVEELAAKFASTQTWATEEQKSVRSAPQDVIQNLALENLEYEKRFGHVFLICATGKSAEEMLAMLRIRIQQTPEVELKTAAQEQIKITRIRLEKLLKL